MHGCKHELYPNQVSPKRLISLRKLVTNPPVEVGRGGDKGEELSRENKVVPVTAVAVDEDSLPISASPPIPLAVLLSVVRGYLQHAPRRVPPPLFTSRDALVLLEPL